MAFLRNLNQAVLSEAAAPYKISRHEGQRGVSVLCWPGVLRGLEW